MASKVLQYVVDTVDRFYGHDVIKDLCCYKRELEANHISEAKMINSFEIVVVPDILNRIK